MHWKCAEAQACTDFYTHTCMQLHIRICSLELALTWCKHIHPRSHKNTYKRTPTPTSTPTQKDIQTHTRTIQITHLMDALPPWNQTASLLQDPWRQWQCPGWSQASLGPPCIVHACVRVWVVYICAHVCICVHCACACMSCVYLCPCTIWPFLRMIRGCYWLDWRCEIKTWSNATYCYFEAYTSTDLQTSSSKSRKQRLSMTSFARVTTIEHITCPRCLLIRLMLQQIMGRVGQKHLYNIYMTV
jgi:hypothetical protein